MKLSSSKEVTSESSSLVNLTDNYNKTEFLLAELSCKREWNLNKGICFSMPRENPRLEFDNAALVKFQSSYTLLEFKACNKANLIMLEFDNASLVKFQKDIEKTTTHHSITNAGALAAFKT